MLDRFGAIPCKIVNYMCDLSCVTVASFWLSEGYAAIFVSSLNMIMFLLSYT